MRILGPSLSLLRRGWARGLDLGALARTALGRGEDGGAPPPPAPGSVPPAPPEPPAKPPREK